jgi:hypothetical protein
MSHKTLSEAAAEVLNKSRRDSYSEPMKHETPQPASSGEVKLSGQTLEDPQGGAVGVETAAARPQATPPGVKPPSDSNEPMKKLATQPGETAGRALVSPEDLNGSMAATGGKLTGADYMHPTTEDVELTDEELAEAKSEKLAKMKEKMKSKDCKEDVAAILSGETISESFKVKLTTIFEAAVISKAVMVVEEMEADILAAAEQSVEEIKQELEENVDTYLTVMVEEWKQENQVAIESGLKAEVVEDFLNGLKSLFTEHYIEIPSEKVDVVESLSAEVAELTERLNNTMNSNVELSKKINEATKKEVTHKVCEGLTATQAGKVKTLAEGVEFTTAGEYEQKLKVIRESYFSQVKNGTVAQPSQVALIESTEEVPGSQPASKPVNQVVAAVARSIR